MANTTNILLWTTWEQCTSQWNSEEEEKNGIKKKII